MPGGWDVGLLKGSKAVRLGRFKAKRERGIQVSGFQIFVMRAILAAVFAVVIARVFYPQANLAYVAGLAIILVILAYFAEYLRKRRKK